MHGGVAKKQGAVAQDWRFVVDLVVASSGKGVTTTVLAILVEEVAIDPNELMPTLLASVRRRR